MRSSSLLSAACVLLAAAAAVSAVDVEGRLSRALATGDGDGLLVPAAAPLSDTQDPDTKEDDAVSIAVGDKMNLDEQLMTECFKAGSETAALCKKHAGRVKELKAQVKKADEAGVQLVQSEAAAAQARKEGMAKLAKFHKAVQALAKKKKKSQKGTDKKKKTKKTAKKDAKGAKKPVFLEAEALAESPYATVASLTKWGKNIEYAYWQGDDDAAFVRNMRTDMSFSDYAVGSEYRQPAIESGVLVPRVEGKAHLRWSDQTHMIAPQCLIKWKRPTANQMKQVEAALAHIAAATCITFTEVAADKAGLKLMFGRSPVATMNDNLDLGSSEDFSTPAADYEADPAGGFHLVRLGTASPDGVVLHELGHALGFAHTMKRKNFAKYLEVHGERTKSAEQYAADPQEFITKKVLNRGPFDYGSVMQYDTHVTEGFLSPQADKANIPKNEFGLYEVMKPLKPSAGTGHGQKRRRNGLPNFGGMGQRDGLSETDVAVWNRVFKCESKALKRPKANEVFTRVGKAQLCRCPTLDQYKSLVAAGKTCLPTVSNFRRQMFGTIEKAALAWAHQNKKDFKNAAATARAFLSYNKARDNGKAKTFYTKCMAFCREQRAFAKGGCWVDAARVPTRLVVPNAAHNPKPWSWSCGRQMPYSCQNPPRNMVVDDGNEENDNGMFSLEDMFAGEIDWSEFN